MVAQAVWMRVLVLDDGRPGHRNQSLAFCRLKGLEHRLVRIEFLRRYHKFLTYPADWLKLHTDRLFRSQTLPDETFLAVVSAGSGTYYANKVLARRLGIPSVVLMMPRGYRLDFDWIIAPEHDRPPARPNIVTTPVNLCQPEPEGVFQPQPGERYISVVLGGPNKTYDMNVEVLRATLEQIIRSFPEHRTAITTSPRTPPEVERLVEGLSFDYKVIYSRDHCNPIPDFMTHCDWVFVTADSTSMLSEAVCFGQSQVAVLPLTEKKKGGKFQYLTDGLVKKGAAFRFAGEIPAHPRQTKIDLKRLLDRVEL